MAFSMLAPPLIRVPHPLPARDDLELMIWKDADLLIQPQVMCADMYDCKSAACADLSQTDIPQSNRITCLRAFGLHRDFVKDSNQNNSPPFWLAVVPAPHLHSTDSKPTRKVCLVSPDQHDVKIPCTVFRPWVLDLA